MSDDPDATMVPRRRPPAEPAGIEPAEPAGIEPAEPAGIEPAEPAGIEPAEPAGTGPDKVVPRRGTPDLSQPAATGSGTRGTDAPAWHDQDIDPAATLVLRAGGTPAAGLLDAAIAATGQPPVGATGANARPDAASPLPAASPAEITPLAATRAPSPLATLGSHPDRFDLDQAAFVIGRGRDPVSLPFASVPRLGLPLAEVTAADPATGALTTPLFGLVGPGGTLPRHYTATTGAELRRRAQALHAFLDMLARRFTGMWVRAGAKYRPARDPGPAERALDAVIGMGTAGLAGRIAVPAPSLRYHAGHLAARTRSAERLRAMLAEECGSEVEIVEFAGGWLRLPPSEQSRIGVVHGRLGVDAAVGAQVWDPQARFIIRLGPLTAAQFERLLPGRPLFERLCGLTRMFVGPEQDFVLNPILAADAVPATRVGAGGGRLGLTAWMGQPAPRRRPAADALLRPTPL